MSGLSSDQMFPPISSPEGLGERVQREIGGGGVENEEGQMSQVSKSLHSSNILGLSQETDSDADSIR